MATWQKTITREPPKTKAELREMLAEAVHNTAQPELKRLPKAKGDRGEKAA
jgi:deoxyxylulose-5-phosphate synthase